MTGTFKRKYLCFFLQGELKSRELVGKLKKICHCLVPVASVHLMNLKRRWLYNVARAYKKDNPWRTFSLMDYGFVGDISYAMKLMKIYKSAKQFFN